MGGCCGSTQVEDENKKFEKGGDNDISAGPVTKRGCTDIVCLCIFIAHWVAFIGVTSLGLADGNPARLYSPRDFRGDYCGIEKQWNGGLNLLNQDQLTYTMNVTSTVDLIAKELVCSSAAEAELDRLLSTSQLSSYRCACCKRACKSCLGSLPLQDFTSASALSSSVSGKMGEFTGLSSASSLFSANGMNGDMFSNVWKEATKYFNAICLETCATPTTNVTSSSRNYTYSPPPDVAWKEAWDVLAKNVNVVLDIQNTILNEFTFKALPQSVCPYEARYCVPFPGITFEELSMNYCTFKMAADVVNAIGASASQAYEQLGADNLVSGMGNSLGDAVGDFLQTLDVFVIVSVLSLVIGLVFLILLRFVVGCVVWFAIFAVFIVFLAGGSFVYVRSSQCVGAGLFDSGKTVGSAAAVSASSQITSAATGSATSDESMTGDGKDYRGSQRMTQSGKTCQAWSAMSPHNHTTTAANYNTSGLSENFCRNPEDAPTIWCFTTDPNVRWELCSPIGVLRPDCPQGYAVSGETMRQFLVVLAYIIWGCAAIWVILVCCLSKQIRLAIGVNKVAAMFVYNTPSVILVPIVQVFIAILWCLVWAVCASFLISQVPTDYISTDSFATYAEAYGTATSPGTCTDKWPTGSTWKYAGNELSTNDVCSGNLGDTSDIVPKCWKCAPPRYILDVRFAISFFSYLWNAAFLIAVGQCTIAGAAGVWFFTPHAEKSKAKSVRVGLRNCFRYHLGSLAMGSFILALVQFIRYFCKYLEKQAKAQKNKIMVMVMRLLQCCLYCIEKCIKFLNKNAYIQIALLGKNFCTSAKNAAQLWLRNFARFGVVATLGSILHFLGTIFITASTVFLGYFILQAMHNGVTPVIPILAYISVGYIVSALYMNVFGLAVDTLLHCFIATEEMSPGSGEDFVPGPLRSFLAPGGAGGDEAKSEARQVQVVPTS